MQTANQDNKNNFYMAYALSAAIFITALILSNPAILLASALLLLFAVIMLHSGHIINNLLIKRSKIVMLSGNYRISTNLVSISRKEGELFRAISIALLKPRAGSEVKSHSLKDLLDSLNERFEFSVELSEADKTKILDNLRAKLRMKEIALSRIGEKSYDKASFLKRQIDLINGDISSLASSGKSFQFVIRIKSISTSDDQNDAEAYSAKNIEILANKFSASLGLDYDILRGEALLDYSGV